MRWAYLLVEVGLVFLAAHIGNGIASRFNVIPSSIIRLPSPFLSDKDFFSTWLVFLIVHSVVFLAMFFLAGGGVFQNARRTAIEIYALVFAVTLSSLILFLFFQTPYNPNLLLAIALTTFVLFVFALLIGATLFSKFGGSRNPMQALLHLVGHGLQLMKNESRQEHFALDHPRVGDVGDATVDDHRSVQYHRPAALLLFGELDVGNDEADIVLALDDETNRKITAHDSKRQLDRPDHRLVPHRGLDPQQVNGQSHAVSGDHADHKPEESTGEGTE